ncbi:MAG TPA: hypothetical protein VLG40_01005 [Candidatus Saccharimonas sp.]|nr:hypothetical protein [Candidatus Saccharimonas sp.]
MKFVIRSSKKGVLFVAMAVLAGTQLVSPVFAVGNPMDHGLPYYIPGDTCSSGAVNGGSGTGQGGSGVSPTAIQDGNAKIIIGIAKTYNLGQQGALIGLMVGITETHLTNDANVNVPISETNPNKQGNGADHDSVGIMQQRTSTGWSTFGADVTNNKDGVYQLMDPAYASQAFFGTPPGANLPSNLAYPGALKKGLQNKPNWQSMDPGDAAQSVQGSAPNAYNQNKTEAQAFLSRLWDASTAIPLPVSITGGTAAGGGATGAGGCAVGGLGNCSSPTTTFDKTVCSYAWSDYRKENTKDGIAQQQTYKDAVAAAQKTGQYVGGVQDGGGHPGNDCGGFVTLLVKNSGMDANYNKYNGNTFAQQKYLDEQVAAGKYKVVQNPDSGSVQKGDVAIINSSGEQHTFIYVGPITGFGSKIASASVYPDERAPMADTSQTIDKSYTWYRLVQPSSALTGTGGQTQGTPQP